MQLRGRNDSIRETNDKCSRIRLNFRCYTFSHPHRLIKESVKVDFGTANIGRAVEGSTALGDFPYWSKEKLGKYRMGPSQEDIRRITLPGKRR